MGTDVKTGNRAFKAGVEALGANRGFNFGVHGKLTFP
jgi:hypothetical protein